MLDRQMNIKKDIYKSPVAAAIWSAFLPGFGQLYVGDYFIGVILLIWEIMVNITSHLNWSIYYSFTGQLQQSANVVNWGWGLFYPSIYVFNLWHAYDRAKVINHELDRRGVPKPQKYANNLGPFTGLMLGMFFGLHWTFLISPVFSGIVLGGVGAVIGYFMERFFNKKSLHKIVEE